VRLFRRELGCDPAPPVFLAAEPPPVKATGPASPARVHALVEAGQAQVAAGATEAAIQVMRTACDEAARTGNATLEATAQLALGATLIDAGAARHQDGEVALHRAIALADASGQPRIAASAYRHLAGSDVLRGFYSRADRRLADAEAIAVPDRSEHVELAAIRGVSVLDQGDPAGAISVFGAAWLPTRTGRTRSCRSCSPTPAAPTCWPATCPPPARSWKTPCRSPGLAPGPASPRPRRRCCSPGAQVIPGLRSGTTKRWPPPAIRNAVTGV